MLESLICKVKEHFPKRKSSCIKNIILLAMCILEKETVNINKLKKSVNRYTNKTSKVESNYKRLIRIFDDHSRSQLWIELLKYVFQMLRFKSKYLILDGTSWKRGERWFHYTTLSVVYKGVSIPIYWMDIAKQGLSSTAERTQLFNRAFKHFNLAGKILLADREYIGKDWFKYLIDNQIGFIIRVQKTNYKSIVNKYEGLSHQAMKRKVIKSRVSQKSISKLIEIHGITLQFVAIKNPKNDPKDPVIFLLTNLIEKPAKLVAEEYCVRTKIEQCFKHLKSNGFQLEQLNLRTKTRCRLLMAVTIFTYVLSINEGLKTYEKVPLKLYPDGSIEKAVSVFRHGLDQLISKSKNLIEFYQYFIGQIDETLRRYQSPFRILSSS